MLVDVSVGEKAVPGEAVRVAGREVGVNVEPGAIDIGIARVGKAGAGKTVQPTNRNPMSRKRLLRIVSLSSLKQFFQVGNILGGTPQDVEGGIRQEFQSGC